MKGRYDYIQYDQKSAQLQALFKVTVEALQHQIDLAASSRHDCTNLLETKDAKAGKAAEKAAEHYHQLATDALEVCYMNIGKLLRTTQVMRTGESKDIPERSNG